jgi:hypothetical protein
VNVDSIHSDTFFSRFAGVRQGCDLVDAHGVLEGGGKYRRHIKIETAAELEEKHVQKYVAQAFANVKDLSEKR